MELEDYVQKFAEMFDETSPDQIHAETEFKALDEWSSLMALQVITMADEQLRVKLLGEDIRRSETIGELFEIVKSRLQ